MTRGNWNIEKLTQVIGSPEKVEKLRQNHPEDFKKALEKIHLLEDTHIQLEALKNDVAKTPKEKLDIINQRIDQITATTTQAAPSISIEKLEAKWAEQVKAKKEEALQVLRKQAGEKMPFGIGEKLFDLANLSLSPKIKEDKSIIGKIINTLVWPIAGLWKIIGGAIMGFLWLSKWYEKIQNISIENIITPEKISFVKDNISQVLVKKLWVTAEQVDAVVDNKDVFTDEKILNYYKQIKSGKGLKYKSLMADFKSIDTKNILLTEKEEVVTKQLNILKSQIEKQYNKTLTSEETQSLTKIFNKHFWENFTTEIHNGINNKELQIKDFDSFIVDGAWFMFDLVWSRIIDVSDMIWNFSSKRWDLVNVSFGLLPFTNNIAIDTLVTKIQEMPDEQRGLFLGLLYRKWGLFLDIIWSVTSASTRLLLDIWLPANTGVDGIKMFTDSFRSAEKQISNLSKIEAAIKNTEITSQAKNFQESMLRNMSTIRENAQIIELLKQHDWTEASFNKLKKSPLIADRLSSSDKKSISNFDGLRKSLKTNIKVSFHDSIDDFVWSNTLKEKYIWFGKNTQMQKFDRVLSDISKNQARIISNKLDLWVFKKLQDSLEIAKVSHVSDRLLFELRSKKDAKAFMKQMNTLAQTSPDLIKWFFSKLPIISVVGLAANDEDFGKSLLKESQYLIPLIGPYLMIREWWISWEKGYPEILDPLQTGIAGWLLALDGFIGVKAFKNRELLKFIWKPAFDIIDIGKGTAKWSRAIYRTGQMKKSGDMKRVANSIRNALSGRKKLLALAIGGILLSTQAFGDEGLDAYKNRDGDMDKEKIRAEFKRMPTTEKANFLKLFFTPEVQENMTFDLNGDVLSIISNTPEAQEDWFIDDSIRANIQRLLGIQTKFIRS